MQCLDLYARSLTCYLGFFSFIFLLFFFYRTIYPKRPSDCAGHFFLNRRDVSILKKEAQWSRFVVFLTSVRLSDRARHVFVVIIVVVVVFNRCDIYKAQ